MSVRSCLLVLTGFCLVFLNSGKVDSADSLVSDISESQVAITSNFTGKRLVLFGAIGRDASAGAQLEGIRDIIVVIEGPKENIVVRKKERIAGIWVNAGGVEFTDVPSFYFIAGSRDFDLMADPVVYRRRAIGADHLRLEPVEGQALSEDEKTEYKRAIVRNLKKDDLFVEVSGGVTFLDQTLFRTTVDLPANVPDGDYRTKVFLLNNGVVQSVQSKPLYINKSGIERSIFEFAHDQPLAYGVLAVLFAFLAGWLASLMFRKD